MLNGIKAAIFDLDGTLVNSLWVWDSIDNEYLSKHNIIPPKNLHTEICHLSFIDTAKYFKERFNILDDIETIMNEWHEMALYEYCNNVHLRSGAKEFLDLLKKKNIKIALATSNSEQLLTATLKNNNIYEYFDCITTTSEVNNGKDHPDVYLLSAKKLNVSPDECIVFEDILAAVQGAKKANMKVFAIKEDFSLDNIEEIKLQSDYFFESFTNLL